MVVAPQSLTPSNLFLTVPSRCFCLGFFLFNVCFVGGSGSFSLYMFLFLVKFGFLSHHLFGKGLLALFIICLIYSLSHFMLGGLWDLNESVPDRCPLQLSDYKSPEIKVREWP